MARMFKNLVTTCPADVEDGDCFALKIVAVAGVMNGWAAYCGLSEWSDDDVAARGDRLLREHAEPLFYVMRASGREYRR